MFSLRNLISKLKGGAGDGATGSTSFLPEDYLRRKAESRSNTICLTLFGVVIVGVVGAFFVTNRAWNSVRLQQAEINRQYTEQTQKIEQLKALEAQKDQMLAKAEITTALIEKVPRSILLAELINRMPERVTMQELEIKSRRVPDPAPPPGTAPKSLSTASGAKGTGGPVAPPLPPKPPRMEYTLMITGLSASDEAVADYQAGLRSCGLLDRVDLISSVEATVDQMSIRKFRLEALIRADADARKIEPLKAPRMTTLKSAVHEGFFKDLEKSHNVQAQVPTGNN